MSEAAPLSVEFFSTMPAGAVEELARSGLNVDVPAGGWVYRQGDVGESVFAVVSGSVEAVTLSEAGVESAVFDWGPGDVFGEECLFVPEPRRESARATAPSRVFRVDRGAFQGVRAAFPAVEASLSNALFKRVSRMTDHLHRSAEMEDAYLKFIASHGGGARWRPLGRSESLRRVRESAESAAKNQAPVLLVGPPGTEKLDVARSVHANGPRPAAPFLVMDARAAGLEKGRGGSAEGSGSMARELAQDLSLFGCRVGIPTASDVDRLGLLRVGAGGTVLVENVECLSVEVQSRLCDFVRDGCYLPMGADSPVRSNARLMASTAADLPALAADGSFHGGLLSCFQEPFIQLPPLSKRKKDILAMAEGMVQEFARRAEKKVDGISPPAVVELLEYSWPGNTEELAATIRCAVDLAQGSSLVPEDLFVGAKPAQSGPVLDILQWGGVKGFVRSRWFPRALQWTTGAAFALIIALGFWGNQSPHHNVALILAWALWEPAVIWGAMLAGRVWCAVCPIGGINTLISSRLSLKRRIPPWLRKHGLKLGAGGLAAIILVEEAAAMPYTPVATAALVLAILTGGVVFAFLYSRRAWCRYVCPFGGMVGLFSSCAALEFRANTGVCDNECKSHACYKGGGGVAGCPLFEGPFMLRANTHCVMCGQCVKACQHGALRLNLRFPGAELWAAAQPIPAIVTYLPVVVATQLFRQIVATGALDSVEARAPLRWAAFFLLLAALTAASAWWTRASGRRVFGRGTGVPDDSWGFFAHALLPLSLAFELGYQAQRMLERAGLFPDVLVRQLGIFAWSEVGAAAVPWVVRLLQIGLCFAGTLASCGLLKKLSHDHPPGPDGARHTALPVLALGLVYVALFAFGREGAV